MIKVANGKTIRHLSLKSLKSAWTRNIVAILAIALTTVLFTSLFTIAASINYSYQQENFRRAGGDGHATFKDVTEEQIAELREDPLIVESSTRLFVGMPHEKPFNKSHVEVSYIEPKGAAHYFCTPVEGTLPREGTDEAATDTHVLALLGVEPKVGTKFTMSFSIDDGTSHPQTVERTFTLSGWWEYDQAMIANNVLLPLSAAREIVSQSAGGQGNLTGMWNLDVMFKNSLNIRKNLDTVLKNHGYQSDSATEPGYISTGVNWGYTGDKFSTGADPTTVTAIAAVLALIVFTGYLVIYNVFQISVTNDIRFYGLLKTIGTTGKQLKQIIRQQALLLSFAGIPIGLVLGFAVGNLLTPIIMNSLSYKNAFVTFDPWIFIGAAVFALGTVFLSCARPGRMAARISPVEAVRYTDGTNGENKRQKATKGGRKTGRKEVKKVPNRALSGASLPQMAFANLGRSRNKTLVTMISLSLAVVLMTMTYTLTTGLDMEKYLSGFVVTDFIVGYADHFVASSGGLRISDQAVPEELIAGLERQGGITSAGRIYARDWNVEQAAPEEWVRESYGRSQFYTAEDIDQEVAIKEHLEDGRLMATALLYGMEDFPLSKLRVVEGDIEKLKDPANNAIAAVCNLDDYGQPRTDVSWARVGDTVKLRFVSTWAYYDLETGEELTSDEVNRRYNPDEYGTMVARPDSFTEKEYTVCALVTVPHAISFRFGTIGGSDYVLGAELFRQDVSDDVMTYVYDTTEEGNGQMEAFLADYTETAWPEFDYESKQSYMDEFEGFRRMFLTLGGVLSFITGLVGVLNFFNAILTGILARKRELAVLQSVGMTGGQLKTMLMFEGLLYTLGAIALALVLSGVLGVLVSGSLENLLSFFHYRFTVTPIVLLAPVFILLGCLVPLAVYRSVAKSTIVERLRQAEA